MLVLTRKVQETLVIDDGRIVVQVLGSHNGRVRLGITADKSVHVARGEIRGDKECSGASESVGDAA